MATKLYTGILASYNNNTKIGSIVVDFSSDPNQPNIFITDKDLPEGFVFKDAKYKSELADHKTVQIAGKTVTIKKEIIEKDSNGNHILIQTKVSFEYEKTTKKVTNLTIL